MKKLLIIVLTAVLTALSLIMPAFCKQILTLDRVIAVDEQNLILEFSGEIAINLNGASIGPWVCIRVMDQNNQIVNENGDLMQVGGTFTFLEEDNHSRAVFTIDTNNVVGVTNLSEFLNKEGEFARFKDDQILFCVEEIPFDSTNFKKDHKVENVTNLFGTTALEATTDVIREKTYEAAYNEIEIDFDYELYPQDKSSDDSNDNSESLIPENETKEIDGKTYFINYTLLFIEIGVAVLAIIIAIIFLAKSKKKNGG